MNWWHPTNQTILAIMLGVAIVGSAIWKLAIYIGNATGWW